ncbi:hypothetical protein CDD81_2005 [Ophiocordyceps australis]|uniref:DUF7357 domain-containing protein n=1 Tax=Ophiocordyceps australis TaxID=1399860 RepID=A0A2C5YDL3_9HYPO|nr:hypothetical protein CDD81_2005 [Ophiocordyceps australis]
MPPNNLRLRLTVERHGVPDVKLAWSCNQSPDLTISKFLEQVNKAVPLESGEWGLEDYVVELVNNDGSTGYECLHYQQTRDILKDEDQLLIRCLMGDELRRRRLNGRHQISTDGRHLVDGVVFGRPWLRSPRGRPAIELPPRKRPRIMEPDPDIDQDVDLYGDEEDQVRGYIQTPESAEDQEDSEDASYQASENSSDTFTDRMEEDAMAQTQRATGEKASEVDNHETESCTSSSSIGNEEDEGNTSSSSSDEDSEDSQIERQSERHDDSTTSLADSDSSTSCSESVSEYDSHVAEKGKKYCAADDASFGVVDNENFNDKLHGCSDKVKTINSRPLSSISQLNEPPHTPVPPGKGSKKTWKRNQRRRTCKEALKRKEMEQLAAHKERLMELVEKSPPAKPEKPSVEGEKDAYVSNGTRQESATEPAPSYDIFRPPPLKETEQDLPSNHWSSKLDYYAVECQVENVVLSQPPFPFNQRWSCQQSNGKKRSRGNQWPNRQHWANADHDDDNSANADDLNRERSCEMSFYSGDPDLADETTNCEGGAELKKPRLNKAKAVDKESCQNDLPPVPANLLSLPVLEPQTGLEGKVLTWQQLELSKRTQWQPQYVQQTGVVLAGSDGQSLMIRLAMRDRQDATRQYDPNTGEPIYDMFEIPYDADGNDEDTSGGDDGEIRLSWEQMVEPRIVPLDAN